MHKQTRAKLFLELWDYWRKYFKLPPLETRADLRYNAHACVETWSTADNYHARGYVELVYNPKKLSRWSIPLIINCVLHEIGHYKNNLSYNTFKQQVRSEYKAERFAVSMMKKYYPTELKEVIKHVQTRNLARVKWQKEWPVHFQAYLQIKEYTN